jgi:MFS family permease
MVGPLYGVEVGLTPDRIALFLAAFVAGGALAQYPAGWLADKFDRRTVLIGMSAASMAACAATVALSDGGGGAVMLGAALFGFATFPIYSVAAAHAHDYASTEERVELSAALMFLYAVGAIASPVVVSALIARYGPAAMFVFVAVAHLALVLFGIARMRARPAETRTRYVYAPRTSFLVGRLIGWRRDR